MARDCIQGDGGNRGGRYSGAGGLAGAATIVGSLGISQGIAQPMLIEI